MKNSKKKKMLAIAAALALIAVLSGTFAWITAQDQRVNRAESAKVDDDSVLLTEIWEPKKLVAGTEAKKEVAVSNTGNANVFVRVSYEEVLKHLTEKGEKSYHTVADVPTAKYTYNATDDGLGHHMPISFNGAKAYADGFVIPTGTVQGLEADTKLLVKGGKTVSSVTGDIETNYEVKIMHEYFTHGDNTSLSPGDPTYDASKNKYQIMKATVTVGDQHDSLDAKDWDFTVSNSQYGYYENGYMNTAVNWAKSSLEDEDGVKTGYSLLGTDGTRYSVGYDYTLTGLGVSALPGITPAPETSQKPIAPSTAYSVQADKNGLTKESIQIGYGADITDVATLADDKWVYNTEDGWFYYTVPLQTGETTPDLLKKLIFKSDMGKEYANASYDLVVKMEAIQASRTALISDTGWHIGEGSEPTGDTLTIVNKLRASVPADS